MITQPLLLIQICYTVFTVPITVRCLENASANASSQTNPSHQVVPSLRGNGKNNMISSSNDNDNNNVPSSSMQYHPKSISPSIVSAYYYNAQQQPSLNNNNQAKINLYGDNNDNNKNTLIEFSNVTYSNNDIESANINNKDNTNDLKTDPINTNNMESKYPSVVVVDQQPSASNNIKKGARIENIPKVDFNFNKIKPGVDATTTSSTNKPTLSPTNTMINSKVVVKSNENIFSKENNSDITTHIQQSSSKTTTTSIDNKLASSMAGAPSINPINIFSKRPSIAEEESSNNNPPLLRRTIIPTTTRIESMSTLAPSIEYKEIIFYVIGDIPYNSGEAKILSKQIRNIPSDADFIFHVGDITSAGKGCHEEWYMDVKKRLLKSNAPVFILPGDNDWSDCKRPIQAWTFWRRHFQKFDTNWNKSNPMFPKVIRQNRRRENLSFVYNNFVLFIGIHLVGVPKGEIKNPEEWKERMNDDLEFVLDQMHTHRNKYSVVVLIGHAKPRDEHNPFFIPLYKTIEEEYSNIPTLYVHGDGHAFSLQYNMEGVDNLTDVEVDQGKNAPPLRIKVTNNIHGISASMPFQIARYY